MARDEILTVPRKKAPANYVPEASVIRRVQALSGFIGRKVYRRCSDKFLVQAQGLTLEKRGKLLELSLFGGTGTLGGGVKSVDIEWNTNREGRFLGQY